MQTKKNELKSDILKAAEREFLVHGYCNGSMRSIAKRANTTVGNIYHYFSRKAALLDEIIGTLPEELGAVIHAHQNLDLNSIHIPAELSESFFLSIPGLFPLDLLLSPRFLILLGKSEGSSYDETREQLIQLFNNHLKWHLNLKNDSILTETLLHTFLSSLLFIGTIMKNMEDGRKHLMKYIKVMSLGFPVKPDDKPEHS